MTTGREGKIVRLPDELYLQIEKNVKYSNEFKSVDEYVIFVLQEVLKEDIPAKKTFTEKEEAEVKKRLKALGYLD